MNRIFARFLESGYHAREHARDYALLYCPIQCQANTHGRAEYTYTHTRSQYKFSIREQVDTVAGSVTAQQTLAAAAPAESIAL